MEQKKIGILGGTFDPPHRAHLAMAEEAARKLKLDKVIFMLAARPPHKETGTPVEQRKAMVKLMIKPYPQFEVSDLELLRARQGHPSYTVDTIKQLKRIYPRAEIYWLMGEDSYCNLLAGRWKQSEEVLRQIRPVVFPRPGQTKAEQSLPSDRIIAIEHLPGDLSLSSTKIRQLIKQGEKTDQYLTDSVLQYIEEKKLYR